MSSYSVFSESSHVYSICIPCNIYLRVDYTSVLDVQIGCAVNHQLHLNADWMCSKSVPRDTTLHTGANLHAGFFICVNTRALRETETKTETDRFSINRKPTKDRFSKRPVFGFPDSLRCFLFFCIFFCFFCESWCSLFSVSSFSVQLD
jgi:hypothetical protein